MILQQNKMFETFLWKHFLVEFFDPITFLVEKYFGRIVFSKLFCRKFFDRKNFKLEKFFWLYFFFVGKIFSSKNVLVDYFVRTENFVARKIFISIISYGQKFFGPIYFG